MVASALKSPQSLQRGRRKQQPQEAAEVYAKTTEGASPRGSWAPSSSRDMSTEAEETEASENTTATKTKIEHDEAVEKIERQEVEKVMANSSSQASV